MLGQDRDDIICTGSWRRVAHGFSPEGDFVGIANLRLLKASNAQSMHPFDSLVPEL